jgi:integrase/recombinase XerD
MLSKQAKVLNSNQIRTVLSHIGTTRAPNRNRLIFLLSVRAGLRAKEIAALQWSMVTDAEGWIGEVVRLPTLPRRGGVGESCQCPTIFEKRLSIGLKSWERSIRLML